jgi:HEAT repeat protein
MRQQESLPDLLLVASEDNEQLIWCIPNSIGEVQSRRATRELLRFVRLREPSPRRNAVIYALGLIGDPRAAPALIHTLSNRSETKYTRALTADAFGSLTRQRRALRALLQNHNDPSVEVRFTVVNALSAQSQNPEVREVLRQHLTDAGRLDAMRVIGDAARSALGIAERSDAS